MLPGYSCKAPATPGFFHAHHVPTTTHHLPTTTHHLPTTTHHVPTTTHHVPGFTPEHSSTICRKLSKVL